MDSYYKYKSSSVCMKSDIATIFLISFYNHTFKNTLPCQCLRIIQNTLFTDCTGAMSDLLHNTVIYFQFCKSDIRIQDRQVFKASIQLFL